MPSEGERRTAIDVIREITERGYAFDGDHKLLAEDWTRLTRERAAARLGADSHGRADERAAIVKWLRNAAKARPAIINPDYLEHFALNIEMGAHSVWCSAPPQKTQEDRT